MKLIDRTGHRVETDNAFTIEQLLKHGAREIRESKGKKKEG